MENNFDTWELGTVKIPNSQWKQFKASISRVYNFIIEKDFAIALDVYEKVCNSGKGKRRFNYRNEIILKTSEYNLRADSVARIEKSMFPDDSSRKKPLKPKKKNFPYATNRTLEFDLENSLITLSNDNKTFSWQVNEGFNAVEEARSHPLARAAFNALEEINWIRNSGGVILANPDNNSESTKPSVAKSYGPLGKKGVLFNSVAQ